MRMPIDMHHRCEALRSMVRPHAEAREEHRGLQAFGSCLLHARTHFTLSRLVIST